MLKSLKEIQRRRSELQTDHESDVAALKSIQQERASSKDPFNLELLQREKILQDKMMLSFIELAQANACESEMKIAHLTNRNPLKATKAVKDILNKSSHFGRRDINNSNVNLPLKKRSPRVRVTSRKAFYHKCKDLQAMFTSSMEQQQQHVPVQIQPQPKPMAEECTSLFNIIIQRRLESDLKPPATVKKPDPPGIGVEATASLLTLSCPDFDFDTGKFQGR